MNKQITRKLTPSGLVTMKFLQIAEDWKTDYTVHEIDSGAEKGKFWIEELKGCTFTTSEEAWEFCYADFCNKHDLISFHSIFMSMRG